MIRHDHHAKFAKQQPAQNRVLRTRARPLRLALAALLASPLTQATLDTSNSEVFSLASLGERPQTDSAFGFSLAATSRRLLIGAPNYTVGGKNGGAVFELVFPRGGGDPTVTQWSQSSPDVYGGPEDGDRFGHSIAAAPSWGPGRFMVGVPREDLKDVVDAGMVNFIGFRETTSHSAMRQAYSDTTSMSYFHQGRFNIKGKVEADDRVGDAIALGDLNGDGGVDLVIGAVTEDVGNTEDAGSINVLMYDPVYQLDRFAEQYTHFNNSLYSQRVLMGARDRRDYFGNAIAIGDFNADGAGDIAVGSYGDTVSGVRAGSVNIIYGESIKWTGINEGGPALPGNELINQALDGVGGDPENDDLFGFALAARDNILVVGAPGEDLSGKTNSGAVHIFQGKPSKNEGLGFGNITGGLVTTALGGRKAHHETTITQRTENVPGASESGDMFGAALAIGDLNDDDIPDIVIASPGEDLKRDDGNFVDAGMITVLYGARNAAGLYVWPAGAGQAISAASIPGLGRRPRTGARFGYALAIADLNGDGKDDLAIGNGSAEAGWGQKYNDTPQTEGHVVVIYQ